MRLELISVHVPKTAGTSFGRILTQVYGESAVFRHYEGEVDPDTSIADQIRPGHRAVHGHFAVQEYEALFPDARRVAWIRHPVSWLVSYYCFLPYLEPNANPAWLYQQAEQPSLLEFAAHESVRSTCQSALLGRGDLAEFDFVGLQEHLAEDLADLGRMMGWPPSLKAPSENRNPAQDYRRHLDAVWCDRRLFETLADVLGPEMGLYEAARRLRRARRARMTRSAPRPRVARRPRALPNRLEAVSL